MTMNPIWITEQDVVELMQLPTAIEALEQSMAAEYKGEARNMNKTMLQYGKSNLHALGGQYGSLVGTKTWTHAESGTCPLLLLWDAQNGQIVAIIEAFALGNLRTGATSGLATKWASSPDSTIMAIAGCGKQALSQVAAVLAVRPIEELRAFSQTFEKSEAFADKVSQELNIKAVAVPTMEEAAAQADVITLATRATEPFLCSRFVKNGAHINAIGAIGPDREEFSQDLFERAGTICADALDSVKKLSREFIRQFENQSWDRVKPIGQVIADGQLAWDPNGISLFKAMGMGLSDVALGDAILKLAINAGKGRAIEPPKKSPIKLSVGTTKIN
ncbi:MAG: hypothetical protein OQK09_07455 [Colwellia sp.]|nr:hypothetical protein [Colwellia sp.]MCW8863696.1 hypothetical protein [Colwellia sp.]MCW9081335.1 hypothetical protein [Colwellia sp.]